MEKIKILREEAGLTKQELEKELGVGNGMVGKWELGRCKPSLDAISKIAKYFNKPIEYFLEEEDTKIADPLT